MMFHVSQSYPDDNQNTVTVEKPIEDLISSLREKLAKVELQGENLVFSFISKTFFFTLYLSTFLFILIPLYCSPTPGFAFSVPPSAFPPPILAHLQT
jgi:hypothetical protein